MIPTEEALDESLYDYIAVFIGADYCPHCKAFAPTVNASAPVLEQQGKCKTIFVSNDRTPEAFHASCQKNQGLDLIMPYDLDKTRAMRDLFKLKTIPALMILRNYSFHDKDGPTVVSDGRHPLVADPQALHFPWAAAATSPDGATKERMSAMDRLIIRGKYGKWWELGHHVNAAKPGAMYMDEHAVRIRAGFLNLITFFAFFNIFMWREPAFVKYMYPIVAWEFLTSANIGLTPLSPLGTVATLLSILLHDEPHWKPANPKRFAWYVGLTLATVCLIIFLMRKDMDPDTYRWSISLVAGTCSLATWLESSAGFCIGCFVYNTWLVPLFKLEECSECKL
jgi:thiol-disulfide isomerase/thioredoxin